MSVYTHRRGSIFWALTLIAIGALFLYNNFNPSVHPWQIIARWWPVLIIFWGLSKLVDYLHAQAHPESAPTTLFSASEVVLLILILLFGSLVSKIVLHPWHEWPGAFGVDVDQDEFANLFLNSYNYTSTLSQPVTTTPTRLLVLDRRGDIQVIGGDSNQKTIEAVIKETIRTENETAAKKLNDQLKFSLNEEAGHYVFQSNLDSLPNGGRGVRLDLVLRVPRATSAELTTERGDVEVQDLTGEQNLTSKHGDVRASKVEGLVRIHKTGGSTEVQQIKGNVEIDGRGDDVEATDVAGMVSVNGDFTGQVTFRNVSQTLRYVSSRTDLTAQRLTGSLDMEMGSLNARGVEGPFELTTKQKDISLDDFRHSVRITDSNGDIRLSTGVLPKQSIDVRSDKGMIELSLPESSAFQIDATSRHGEVNSDFTGPELKVNDQGETPTIIGTVGKGGPTIRLNTSYGTIRIAKGGLRAPAPPKEPKPPEPPQPTKRVTLRSCPWTPRAPAFAGPRFFRPFAAARFHRFAVPN